MIHSIFETLPNDLVWAQILPSLPAEDFDRLCDDALLSKDFHFLYRYLMPAHEERRKRGLPLCNIIMCYVLRTRPFSYIRELYQPTDIDPLDISYWYILQAKSCSNTWEYFTHPDVISPSTLYHLAIEHDSVDLVETVDNNLDDWELEHLLTATFKKRESIVDYMIDTLYAHVECQNVLRKDWMRMFIGDTKTMQERLAILRVSLDFQQKDVWTWDVLLSVKRLLNIPDVIFYTPFML